MKRALIYLLGVFVFGLAYGWLKNALGSNVFLVVAIVYAIALRLLAEKFR